MRDMVSFLLENKEIILLTSSVFTSFGTVGAVIVALWMGYKDSRPKLKVFTKVGLLMPSEKTYLWLLCTNVSKQNVICNGFEFNSNRFCISGVRLIPNPNTEIKSLSCDSPKILKFSENMNKFFGNIFFIDDGFDKILSKHRWIAKIQLKFLWRIVAKTNVKDFQGKLSDDVY